jgi:hypothetical protein
VVCEPLALDTVCESCHSCSESFLSAASELARLPGPKTIRGAQSIAMGWLVGLQTAASRHLNSARELRAASTDSAGSTRDISLCPDLMTEITSRSPGDYHEKFRVHSWRVCRSRLLRKTRCGAKLCVVCLLRSRGGRGHELRVRNISTMFGRCERGGRELRAQSCVSARAGIVFVDQALQALFVLKNYTFAKNPAAWRCSIVANARRGAANCGALRRVEKNFISGKRASRSSKNSFGETNATTEYPLWPERGPYHAAPAERKRWLGSEVFCCGRAFS